MNCFDRGHGYNLEQRPGKDTDDVDISTQTLQFVNREPGHEKRGTTTQEVLRVLIDRTFYCDNCLPTKINEHIIHHLRMALVLHEARALIRKVEKGELEPERVIVGGDGHFVLSVNARTPNYYRNFAVPTTDTGGPQPGTPCHTPPSQGKTDGKA